MNSPTRLILFAWKEAGVSEIAALVEGADLQDLEKVADLIRLALQPFQGTRDVEIAVPAADFDSEPSHRLGAFAQGVRDLLCPLNDASISTHYYDTEKLAAQPVSVK